MVQVLLLELANRNAGDRSAEIPVWLIEGLSQELLASKETEIILPPPATTVNAISLVSTNVSAQKTDPLAQAHRLLRAHPPLTFEELSWPGEDQFSGELNEIYRCSAQVFVDELLRLKDGRACLRATLTELPQHYNWQLAFLRGFRAHFERPLDIEKWWALQLVHFTGRELTQTWAADESWEKLDQTIRSAVQVRAGTNEIPAHTEVTLQTIIRDWDRARQTPALQAKLRELELLRLRVVPDFVPLVDDYRHVLEAYLQERDKARLALLFRKQPSGERAAEEAIRQLDALDAQREALRPGKANGLSATAQ